MQAVGDAMKTALENGTALTLIVLRHLQSPRWQMLQRFSGLASGFASIVQVTNQKIADGYSGMALALSDPSNENL